MVGSSLHSNDSNKANEIYSQFVDGEKKYGQVINCNDKLLSGWHHLRVTTSHTACKLYYQCPKHIRGGNDKDSFHGSNILPNVLNFNFYPDASKALFLISYYSDVKMYQIGELLKIGADPNSRLDETADTPLHRLIRSGCKCYYHPYGY